MLKNITIHSAKAMSDKFVLKMYKVTLVRVFDKSYKKPKTVALRAQNDLAKVYLLKNDLDLDKKIDKFKIINKYDDFFPYVKTKVRDLNLGIDIIRKNNRLIKTPDALIFRNRRQELIKMNFDDRKAKTNKNVMLISSKHKYEFFNNYTSF